MNNTNKITLEDVIRWVRENSEDEEAMDIVNRLTYSFTPKYRERGMKKDDRQLD